ncbi:flagellar export chaperone FliS [Chitinibacter bivalviorum]|uniref:Flagellar secretion chaperone FliS n=1 Tax=Chitinibacter bivalviorum TaxID=2739434 RepID=A0A7H9BFC3_9NEIS|nr:flagellar export chaperone FliS [Chitinibacter bivalviorum]QLG87400.1 flagellar export chaperone FliS [Chitinibacter bivalviorum]
MNANRKALNAYGSASLEHQLESASPHRLVVMLFDGVIKSINAAKFQMGQGNIAEKGKSISKAVAIIEEGLRLSLDKTAGGELAENLDALYEYAAYQLLMANMKNDKLILDQILALMNDLRESWLSIDPVLGAANTTQVDSPVVAGVLNYGRI